jgi:hypothetical protein
MCNAPPLANVKHADDYTIEDMNADVEAFRLAFVQYVRARRSPVSMDWIAPTITSSGAGPTTEARDR